MYQPGPGSERRGGFTLVEMLVALGIILILASLTVAFLPSINDRQRATQGASLVQTTLMTAKQRALRDRAPRGVRLIVDATTANGGPAVTTLQYIEQPPDLTGGSITLMPGPSPGSTATGPYAQFLNTPGPAPDLFGGFPASQPYWAVQPGDYLVVNGSQTYAVLGVTNSAGNNSSGPGVIAQLQANPAAPVTAAQPQTSNYYIARGPRILTGDDPIQLPDKVGIDLDPHRSVLDPQTATTLGTNPGLLYYDILFDPAGHAILWVAAYGTAPNTTPTTVTRGAFATGKVMLWVRDITDNQMGGDQTLITVYTRGGLVDHAQADPGPNNDFNNSYPDSNTGAYFYDAGLTQSPYTYILQGQGSGL